MPPINAGFPSSIIESRSDPQVFVDNMYKANNYNNFVFFFTRELSNSSIPDMLNRYVFASDSRAYIVFNCFFAGYLRPFIHLG